MLRLGQIEFELELKSQKNDHNDRRRQDKKQQDEPQKDSFHRFRFTGGFRHTLKIPAAAGSLGQPDGSRTGGDNRLGLFA